MAKNIKISSEEELMGVLKTLSMLGYVSRSGRDPVRLYNVWDAYGEDTVVSVDVDGSVGYFKYDGKKDEGIINNG